MSRLVAVLVAALAALGLTASGASSRPAPASAAAAAQVSVSVPDDLVEGERYEVRVKVGRTAGARKILLQRQVTAPYADPTWETVKAKRVAGKKRHTFRAVAGEADADRYRARVLYADRRPAMSRTATSTVWHWTALTDFDDYFSTGSSSIYFPFAINGQQHTGWAAYSTVPSWETRWTVGRHCKALRGDLGLQDTSADGASAVVRLVADETQVVFTSATLTPGTVQHVELPLALPYRLAVQAQNTSTADLKTLPAFGAPELLCTGLG